MSTERPKQKQILIDGQETLRPRMQHVWDLVCKGIQAGPVVVELSRPRKSRLQEEHYHALIGEIAKQLRPGGQAFAPKIWKALLVDAFEQEMQQMGTPLSKPGQVVISLDGRRAVTVRPSTTELKKAEAAAFIEWLYAYGVGEGVVFSQPALEIYASYREAK